MIARFLAHHPAFELAATADLPGLTPGRPEWVTATETDALCKAMRLWPHIGPGEGHFIAVLRRAGARGAMDVARGRAGASVAHRTATDHYRAFCDAHLTGAPGADRLTLEGAYLYAAPEGAPPLDGLRVIHPGWWLGVIKTGRFEPSHALALALTPAEARQSLDLAPHDPRLAAYLRGEGSNDPGPPGWVLVTVDGYPVGWGKRGKWSVEEPLSEGTAPPMKGQNGECVTDGLVLIQRRGRPGERRRSAAPSQRVPGGNDRTAATPHGAPRRLLRRSRLCG